MKAVIYARYSSENQREESIDAQIRACREYCDRSDYEVVGAYIDQALTATTDDRPQFQRMVADSHKSEWKYVIVHKLDRFARNRYDSAVYKQKFRTNGVRVLSVLERLDDSPESVIMESMLEGMAEYYSKNLSREAKKGLRENAYNGKAAGGFPPLGYDIDISGHYIVNEQEAAFVRMIFLWAREGMSYKKIASNLNAMGAHTKKGNRFVPSSIHDILRNEKYRGLRIHNRFSRDYSTGKVRRHVLGGNTDTLEFPGGITAIVPETDWFAINKAMDERRLADRTQSDDPSNRCLLTGKIYCGLCGSAMAGHTSRGVRYYRCCFKKSGGSCTLPVVVCSKIDDIVLQALRENILNPVAIDGIIPAIIKQAVKQVHESSLDHDAIRERLSTLDAELERVADAIASIGISETLRAKLKRLEVEKKEAVLALVEIETEIKKYAVDSEGIRDMLERDMEALTGGSPTELRRIIKIYVNRVDVYPPPPGKRSGHKVNVKLRIFKPLPPPGDNEPQKNNMSPESTSMEVPKRKPARCAGFLVHSNTSG